MWALTTKYILSSWGFCRNGWYFLQSSDCWLPCLTTSLSSQQMTVQAILFTLCSSWSGAYILSPVGKTNPDGWKPKRPLATTTNSGHSIRTLSIKPVLDLKFPQLPENRNGSYLSNKKFSITLFPLELVFWSHWPQSFGWFCLSMQEVLSTRSINCCILRLWVPGRHLVVFLTLRHGGARYRTWSTWLLQTYLTKAFIDHWQRSWPKYSAI